MDKDLYSMMLNIKNQDKESIIKSVIEKSKSYLGDTARKCKLYSNYIYNELLKESVPSKLFNTKKDLGMNYEHEAVLVYDNDTYFLIDPTFSQFIRKDEYNTIEGNIKEVLEKGYIKVDNEMFKNYLQKIDRFDKTGLQFDRILLDNIYFDLERTKKI